MTSLSSIPPLVLVATGGALGACGRYLGVSGALALGARAEVGTWGVNVVGCFFLGVLISRVSDPSLRLLLGTGVLGGFTTFSTFSVDTLVLVAEQRLGHAALYVVGSVAVGLFGCALGQWAGGALP